jgi:MarR family transcriptional regulator, organic hydroperoxide resistance regulator
LTQARNASLINRRTDQTARNPWEKQLRSRGKKQLSLQVLKKFRIIYGSVRQQFREVEQTCGVTGSQLWIMQEVANNPGIGVSDLADKLSIHQSTCSQLVEKLVTRKLVIKERSREDQRRVGLRLTEAASTLISKAPGPAEGILPEALSTLSSATIQTLDSSLEKLIEQLQIRDDKLAEKPLSDL